jgi:hypothetical protein
VAVEEEQEEEAEAKDPRLLRRWVCRRIIRIRNV